MRARKVADAGPEAILRFENWNLIYLGKGVLAVQIVQASLVAAIAATSGRLVLAKLSRALVRQKILSDQTKQNVDAIRLGIDGRGLKA